MSALARHLGDYSAQVEATALVVLYACTYGERAQASVALEKLEGLLQSGEPSPVARVGALAWSALYYLGVGRLNECRHAATRALDIANTTGVTFCNCHIMMFNGVAALPVGNATQCRAILDEMAVIPEMRTGGAGYLYHQLAALEAMARREHAQALVDAQECLRSADESGFPYFDAWGQATYAMACFETGRRDEARAFRADALATARAIDGPWPVWHGLCAQAYFALREGDARAIETLQETFQLAREQGYKATPGIRREVLLTLCEVVLRTGTEVEYVREVIAMLELQPELPPWDVERWPWPLTIHTLGRFEVVCDDKLLAFSGKAPKKPLQLLKV